jgi:hypothetical protein
VDDIREREDNDTHAIHTTKKKQWLSKHIHTYIHTYRERERERD